MKKILVVAGFAFLFLAGPVMAIEATETEATGRNGSGLVGEARTIKNEVKDEIKAKVEELKAAKDSQKAKIKAEVLTKVKARANEAVKKAIEKYKKTRERVKEMPNISQESKEVVAGKIDAAIVVLEGQKARIDTSTTADEVRSIMQEVRTMMRTQYNAVKMAVRAIHTTRLQGAITRLSEAHVKLTAKVTELKTAGTDVTEIEGLLVTAKSDIDSARAALLAENVELAKEKIEAARESLQEAIHKIEAAKEAK